MKKTDFLKEIANLSQQELAAKIRDNSEEQMKLRFRKATGQLQDSSRIQQLRRQRARMLTKKSALSRAALQSKSLDSSSKATS